ncbi:MAG: carboxymuconolactone decarboxylase family protein [Pseudomonadota bacterium]
MTPDFAKMFQTMMEQSQQMAKAWNPAMESFQMPALDEWFPTMPKDALEMTMGRTFNPEGLDAKTRLLVTLAALTVLGAQAEDQIRITVRHALEAGATPQEVAEVIGQMAVFGGVPAMTKAMENAQRVIAERTTNTKEGADE